MKKKKCPKCSCGRGLSDKEIEEIDKELKELLPDSLFNTEEHFRINEKLAKDLAKQFKANEAYKKKTKDANFGQY